MPSVLPLLHLDVTSKLGLAYFPCVHRFGTRAHEYVDTFISLLFYVTFIMLSTSAPRRKQSNLNRCNMFPDKLHQKTQKRSCCMYLSIRESPTALQHSTVQSTCQSVHPCPKFNGKQSIFRLLPAPRISIKMLSLCHSPELRLLVPSTLQLPVPSSTATKYTLKAKPQMNSEA